MKPTGRRPGDDGLDATCLATSLRGQVTPTTEPNAPTTPPREPDRTIAARLEELTGLLARGLATQAEYDQRRKAIIDSV